jgi:hypothetical protein
LGSETRRQALFDTTSVVRDAVFIDGGEGAPGHAALHQLERNVL